MTRNENQMYSDITSIRKSLEKIANALDTPNVVYNGELKNTKDIPGFEGTLDALDVLTDIKTITDDYASKHDVDERDEDDIELQTDYVFNLIKNMTKEQYVKFFLEMDFGFALSDTEAFTEHIVNDLEYDEVLDVIIAARNILDEPTSENPDPAGFGNKDPYTYDNDLNEYCDGIKNDSDHDIRSTAKMYFDLMISTDLGNPDAYKFRTKKDCILDYVTNEFGSHGARYTDIIKFAYYLGAHNAPKYTSEDRGYYSCAFNTRFGGHLIKGGKDCLVKGINKEGDERYFAFSFVEQATDYYRYVDNRNAR